MSRGGENSYYQPKRRVRVCPLLAYASLRIQPIAHFFDRAWRGHATLPTFYLFIRFSLLLLSTKFMTKHTSSETVMFLVKLGHA
jgi:hypothetical protein